MRVATRITTRSPRRGDPVTVEMHVHVPAGDGLVEIASPLPAPFGLDAGSNLHVIPAAHEDRTHLLRYRFRAAKRGTYEIPAVRASRIHALGLVEDEEVAVTESLDVDVQPPVPSTRRVRGATRTPSLQASARTLRAGVAGMDFSELRDYREGDALKRINWKATAKRLASGASEVPLVNEVEREGKRTAWILLDAGRRLEVGTTVDNALERSLEAATAIAGHLLAQGHPVGGLAYHARAAHPATPDTGHAQAARLARALAASEPASDRDEDAHDLAGAVAYSRGWLSRGEASFVILTRVEGDAREVLEGLREIRKRSRGRARILVVDVRPWGLEGLASAEGAEGLARAREVGEALDAVDVSALARVRAHGARVLRWHPATEPAERVAIRVGRML